jgi:hypothetical protein
MTNIVKVLGPPATQPARTPPGGPTRHLGLALGLILLAWPLMVSPQVSWVLTLAGYRLAGNHLPASAEASTGRRP